MFGACIPVVGKYISDIADSVIGSLVMIKSVVGIASVVGIILMCMIPIIKLTSVMLVLKLMEAMLEPVVDKKFQRLLGEVASWGISLIGLVLAIFAKEILGVMIHNPAYSQVWTIIPCIVFAYVFQSLYYFFVNVLFIKDTKYVFIITMLTVAINIGLNLLLIPRYGFMGCAGACVVTYFVKSIIALIASHLCNKEISFNWISMYLSSLLAFAISLTPLWMSYISMMNALIIKTLLCFSFFLYVLIRYRTRIYMIFNQIVKK